jgi:hypothetical protein
VTVSQVTTVASPSRAHATPIAVRHQSGTMTDTIEEHNRIAYCECGAQLVGNSRGELFEAAQSHIAHHHPELLGAVGADVVSQMTQVRPGAVSA